MEAYWLEFEFSSDADVPMGTRLGCGVTAESQESALKLVKDRVFRGRQLPVLLKVVRIISMDVLDQDHVVPNMGSIFEKGIWFPLGY